MPDKWGQYVQTAAPADTGDKWAQYAQNNQPHPPDERNGVQRFMDNLTTVTPEQDANTPKMLKPLAHFGAGAIEGATSPFVHPLKTLEGVGSGVSALLGDEDSANQIVNGVKNDPMKALGNVVGGADLGGVAAEAGAPLLAKIPTRAKAMQLFESVAKDAANQPVNLTRTQPYLQKMLQLGKEGGGNVPLPVRQLANAGGAATPKSVPLLRAMQNELNGVPDTAAEPKPLLYPSARNFQSGLSSLSRDDLGNMSGPMKGQLKQLNKAFYGDVSDAADAAGRGEEYAKAMQDYRRASMFNNAAKTTAKWAIPAAVGGGLAGTALKKVMQ